MNPIRQNGRVFLLSPAHCGGKRAGLLLDEGATFDLARQVRTPAGAPLGDVFAFLSGLYFRGKLAYARAFSRPAGARGATVLVITTSRGLVSPDALVTPEIVREFATVDVNPREERFRIPLACDARHLAASEESDVVLLGSIASSKYVEVLLEVFGKRLLFPIDFVGRGDLSRGGLLLRSVRSGRELDYVPVAGAERRGPRPPKLTRPH